MRQSIRRCAAGLFLVAIFLFPLGAGAQTSSAISPDQLTALVISLDSISNLLSRFLSLFSSSEASAQTPGLVAAYSFDEGSGPTAADASGSGNTGTFVGTPQ